MTKSLVSRCYIVPGQAQILLAKDQSPQWASLQSSYERIRQEIEDSNPDIIIYCSTQWLSVLDYMMQGDPEVHGVHVDPNWHELGSMQYAFKIDRDFAETSSEQIKKLGFDCKIINYKGFPIDTGTIVAQKLLNPQNRFPAAMVSCSLYGDQTETTKIGHAITQALHLQKKQAVIVLVSNFSNRAFHKDVDPREDHIFSQSDDEWNKRILNLFEKGALEEVVAQTATFAKQGYADMGFKGVWWISGILGANSSLKGRVFDYQPIYGTGCAIVGLYPEEPILCKEQNPNSNHISSKAPEAVGPYPHARREGNLLFLSGLGPRVKGRKDIPGVTLDLQGNVLSYDITAQTHSVFQNIKTILEECGSSLSQVIDCQVFLTNMKKDFATFNSIYREYFNAKTGPTRTTVEVGSLPTPIAVELKVIARI